MSHNLTATTYLQVIEHPRYGHQAKIVRATQKYPEVTDPGAVVVKIQVKIPAAAFLPLKPEAVVEIPEALVQHPVEVEAVDPS